MRAYVTGCVVWTVLQSVNGVSTTTLAQSTPISAHRALRSSYFDYFDYHTTVESTPAFGAWSVQAEMAGQVSDLALDAITFDLWASEHVRDEPGYPEGDGYTDLSYTFGVDNPVLAAWSHTLTAHSTGNGTMIGMSAIWMTRVFYDIAEDASFYSATGPDIVRGEGITLLRPSAYTLENYATPFNAGADYGASTTASTVGAIRFIGGGSPEPRLLGVRSQAGIVEIDTIGSGFDTVLAVYAPSGDLIAMNDNHQGLQSLVTPELDEGVYLAVIGGAGAVFGDGFSFTPGSTGGNVRLSMNGETVHTGRIESGEVQLCTFDVGDLELPQAADLGVIDSIGPVDIQFEAAVWDQPPNQLVLYDAHGGIVGSTVFEDTVSYTRALEPGVYYLTVGSWTMAFLTGFDVDVSCEDCRGTIEFQGSVGGRPASGAAWGSREYPPPPFPAELIAPFFRFEVVGSPGCNPADFSEPYGVLDLADLTAFVSAFVAGDLAVDLDGTGVLDLADIVAFVEAFNAGCP